MKNKRVSVAMATYNGEKYIKEQIESILLNLEDNDELVISDDGSTDKTIEIINAIADSRIKLLCGPKQGLIKNFENAIVNCSGDYIFLSDQDDIWEPNKVSKVLEYFIMKNCDCIIHDCIIINSDDSQIINNSFFNYRHSRKGFFSNIIKNSYIGCCMAFKKELLKKILPFPKNIAMHDQWIGLISNKYGKNYFLSDKLIRYRRHENNKTNMKHLKCKFMIKNRLNMIFNIVKR